MTAPAQPTPGPWKLTGPVRDDDFTIRAPNRNVVAVVRGLARDPATTEANARLIAASPELLAFVERIADAEFNPLLTIAEARNLLAEIRGAR